MKIGIGIVVIAAFVAGCTASSSNGPEQATNPAAGGPGLSYPAHNMAEFDTAMNNADDHCYKEGNLTRAHYVDRDFETAHFVCAPRQVFWSAAHDTALRQGVQDRLSGARTRQGTATAETGFVEVDETSDIDLQTLLKRRKALLEISPIDVKLLALRFGLTQGQVRGLLMSYGDDPDKLAAEAAKLRRQ